MTQLDERTFEDFWKMKNPGTSNSTIKKVYWAFKKAEEKGTNNLYFAQIRKEYNAMLIGRDTRFAK